MLNCDRLAEFPSPYHQFSDATYTYIDSYCSSICGDADYRIRHGVAACFKVVMLRASHKSLLALSNRCGAQGLFGHNWIVSLFDEMRGIGIAEGNTLVLLICFASKLLLNRYSLPAPKDNRSLLSKYEVGIFDYLRLVTKSYTYRSSDFASRDLPNFLNMTEAIGHRMAYEAAVSDGLPAELIQIFAHDVTKDLRAAPPPSSLPSS
ncbi:hypothetical protein NEOLEDRAFT_1242706 [Neolentinus lepideus HHB14362 ss-1]|uniref:Uncharacterized protein n=1 Tax=Neolentinus lepideus HHB14362 ss-1 TaxID=1314782 RepID=A0A165RTM3_9AGAM|nr:hypothetical protein NEOLEDRAFT_1242706 [Neolentinus lepideus HHB14362 ss-1]